MVRVGCRPQNSKGLMNHGMEGGAILGGMENLGASPAKSERGFTFSLGRFWVHGE